MKTLRAALLLLAIAAILLADDRNQPIEAPPAPRYWDARAWEPGAVNDFWHAVAGEEEAIPHPAGDRRAPEAPEEAKSD